MPSVCMPLDSIRGLTHEKDVYIYMYGTNSSIISIHLRLRVGVSQHRWSRSFLKDDVNDDDDVDDHGDASRNGVEREHGVASSCT